MNATLPLSISFDFDNSYARLPERFYARQAPTAMPAPALIRLNEELASELGLDPVALDTPAGTDIFTGASIPPGADPLAMAYAGHQFGGWAPRLGDGRALLLGEIVGRDGVRRDIQLKGAGRTPFSRSGDGRAVLGPVLREYLVSEGMHGLGIPTTRALAAAFTGETVQRERPFPGAILTRIARSHVRVGTFQYFMARGDNEAVRVLADYVIERHYPPAMETTHPYRALLEEVMARQAALIAKWMHVGFIHGVMNTDNVQIAGETIDYGPCAFMDSYDPATVYSSIDYGGRYAYGNQPRVAHWNLACFAQALMPLLGDDEEKAVAEARAILERYPERYEAAWLTGMRAKLGLAKPADGDRALAQALLDAMHEGKADFTLTFRKLCELAVEDPSTDGPVRELFTESQGIDSWLARWRERLAGEQQPAAARQAAMRAVNPAFIARNHLVEEAIQAALEEDFTPFETLLSVLVRPFEPHPGLERLMLPPLPHQVVQRTFCGT